VTPSTLRINANPWQSHSVRVQHVLSETPGVATYELAFTDPEMARAYRFQPGQFNMLYVPGIGEAAISISSAPHLPHALRHTIRAVGGVTKAIAEGGRGMSLGLRGPFGSNWPMDSCLQGAGDGLVRKDIVIVAGGIGFAPLRSVLYALCQIREQVGRIVVLVGARTPDDLLFRHEYMVWQEQGVEVKATVDRASADWRGNVGVVTGILHSLILPRPEATIVMTCGPEVMMRYVVQAGLQRNIPPDNIWLALERNMNCAVGLCGHCQLGPEFLCKDGPVLPYSRVSSWLKVQAL
jgi:NAD(P)H-flavin reductase